VFVETAVLTVEPTVKPVRGRPFVADDPRSRQNQPPVPERVEPEPARSAILTAYRAVLRNHPKRDLPGLEEVAREVLRKDKKGFLAKYDELERREAEQSAQVAVAAAVPTMVVVEDAGADRVVEAIDRVLLEAAREAK
jgi:hypothetical protein